MNDFRAASRALLPEIVELRRLLHRHPERGTHLPLTRRIVLDALEGLPLEVNHHESTSGIAAVLRGKRPGPTIVLRGDMDALPVQEDTGLPFASEHPGFMHACGHDLHTAMLVGAARILSSIREELAGTVVFMFQPGEEGFFGARLMLEEGLLDTAGARPTGAFAMHVTSSSTDMTASITITPKAIGRGAAIWAAASTSALTFESSWPVGWRRCHSIGSSR
jgi:hippurate hydrolase